METDEKLGYGEPVLDIPKRTLCNRQKDKDIEPLLCFKAEIFGAVEDEGDDQQNPDR
jgi:hypothetical protein